MTKCLRQRSIKRKVINTFGRLGTMYDAATDNLIECHTVAPTRSQTVCERPECQVLPGDPSKLLTSYLKKFGFSDEIQASICLQMVTLSGISRFMEYNRPINELTRFVYYSKRSQSEIWDITSRKLCQFVDVHNTLKQPTHIITEIVWGIELLCIIQVPTYVCIDDVDRLLESVRLQLIYNQISVQLNDSERYLSSQLTDITLYGPDTCTIKMNKSLLTILNGIERWQSDRIVHQPIMYTMVPLKALYHTHGLIKPHFAANPLRSDIVRTMIRLKNDIREFTDFLRELPTHFSSKTLDEYLITVQHQYCFILDSYDDIRKNLRTLVEQVRRQEIDSTELVHVADNKRYECLRQNEIQRFRSKILHLIDKAKLIKKLNNQIEYINVLDIHWNQTVEKLTTEMIYHTFVSIYYPNQIIPVLWFSNDHLLKEKRNEWEQICANLCAEQREIQSRIHFFYVDCSEAQLRLRKFKITKELPTETLTIQCSCKTAVQTTPNVINVVLFGEECTTQLIFINAFMNYLNLQHQCTSKYESILTELNYQQQLAAYECKSYVLYLDDNDVRLRFICTPNFCNEQNFHCILTYMNNFSYLNGICFLLDDVTPQSEEYFRLYFTELLHYLTPVNYSSVLFGFTTSSALHSPLNELIRRILIDEHLNNVPFSSENIFHFDKKLLGLLARKTSMRMFNSSQRQNKCENLTYEFTRFLSFVRTSKTYDPRSWLSPRKAVLDIYTLARPLMEILRLNIYNSILNENGTNNFQMVLCSNSISSEICTTCTRMNIVQCGPFTLTQYCPSPIEVCKYQHSNKDTKHLVMEHLVTYKLVPRSLSEHVEQDEDLLRSFLYDHYDSFYQFLRRQPLANLYDPFLSVLEQFIKEELYISKTTSANKKVLEVLQSIKVTLQKNHEKLPRFDEESSLKKIFRVIDYWTNMPTIRDQLESIKATRLSKRYRCESILKE